MEYLFTYGTLNDRKNKYSNLLLSNSEYIGVFYIYGTLYDMGEYPGLILDEKNKINGNLFKLKNPNILKTIDEYEEFNEKSPEKSLFIRKKTDVFNDNITLKSWIYIYNQTTKGKKILKVNKYLKYDNRDIR